MQLTEGLYTRLTLTPRVGLLKAQSPNHFQVILRIELAKRSSAASLQILNVTLFFVAAFFASIKWEEPHSTCFTIRYQDLKRIKE